jgi:hypothetical protein
MSTRLATTIALALTLALASALVPSAGCESGAGRTAPADAGADGLAPADAAGGPGDVAVLPDGPPAGTSFDNAIPLTLGAAHMDTIAFKREVDHYRFTGQGGDWVRIWTVAAGLPNESYCDTVIGLYDAAQTLLAHDDDAQPWTSTDSEIIIRLPGTGPATFYVTVEDWTGWADQSPTGGLLYAYEVTVATLATGAGVTLDAEPNGTAAAAQATLWAAPEAQSPDVLRGIIAGAYTDGADRDAYAITIPGADGGVGAARAVSFDVMPAGSDNATNGDAYGSTAPVGLLALTDASGATTIGRIDNSSSGAPTALQPPLVPGTYLLWVQHPATALGANDFYVVKPSVDLMDFGDVEAEPAGTTGVNDTLAAAQRITVAAAPGNAAVNLGAFVTRLAPGDIDYFSFYARSTDTITLTCQGARSGSGLQGLTVSVRDPTDAEITGGHAVETAAADLTLSGLTKPRAGMYYLRLTATGQDPTVTGDWAHCGLQLGP